MLEFHFIKKRLQHKCFLVNFAKFLRTDFFNEHLRSLLLNFVIFFFEVFELVLSEVKTV